MTRLFQTVDMQEQLSGYIAKGLLVMLGAIVIALGSQIRVNLPFSPVPITAQTLSVMLIAAGLGPRKAALATGLYLLGGMVGLPWFAAGMLIGPTGGFLIGFVAMSICVGALSHSDRFNRSWLGIGLMLLVGHVVLYIFGLTWLSFFVGSQRVLALGLLPFIPGDLLKLVCAASIIRLAQNS